MDFPSKGPGTSFDCSIACWESHFKEQEVSVMDFTPRDAVHSALSTAFVFRFEIMWICLCHVIMSNICLLL